MDKFKLKKENIIPIALFAVLFGLLMYKLTDASLWYDEAIEYWYSKDWSSRLPFEPWPWTMYERINYTFQPPLFNILMHFWLKIFDTESWFRFLGVIAGMLSVLAIYKTVKFACNKWYAPSISVLLSIGTYQLMYRFLEVAEYYLMILFLSWTLFYFIRYTANFKRKDLVFFVLFSVLSVFSQYGAIFPVLAMSLINLVLTIRSKQKKKIFEILIAYAIAVIVAAMPLFFFFTFKQIVNQTHTGGHIAFIGDIKRLFFDFWKGMFATLRYNFFLNDDVGIVIAALVLIVISGVWSFIFGKRTTKIFNAMSWLSWVLFFLTTETGAYSYGAYENRYGVFFIPIILALIVLNGFDFLEWIGNIKGLCKGYIEKYIRVIFILAVAVYVFVGVYVRILPHWFKEENRGLVEAWYKECSNTDTDTVVYYYGAPGFTYYLYHDDRYSSELDSKIHYWPQMHQDYYEAYTQDTCEKMLLEFYDGEWPDKLYLAVSHYGQDFMCMIDLLNKNGYEESKVFDGREEDIFVFSKELGD